jgi:peptidoglycan hydrolase-like protein with peptidoglycan-binding domain
MQFVLASTMAFAVALCCMLSFAPHARAASLTNDQLSNVQQLLQSYGVSDAKINAVTAVLSDNGMQQMGSSTASSTNCAAPARALMRGMRSDDVKTLQERLVNDGYLSQDNATGFFGSSTEQAVKQWQADSGIVASGTPETTGWGMVGRKSLQELDKCEVHHIENGVMQGNASSTMGMPPMRGEGHGRPGGNSPINGGTPIPQATAAPQSAAGSVGQFLSDYSDAFNQNLAAVATAPYNFYVPIMSDFFTAIGLN